MNCTITKHRSTLAWRRLSYSQSNKASSIVSESTPLTTVDPDSSLPTLSMSRSLQRLLCKHLSSRPATAKQPSAGPLQLVEMFKATISKSKLETSSGDPSSLAALRLLQLDAPFLCPYLCLLLTVYKLAQRSRQESVLITLVDGDGGPLTTLRLLEFWVAPPLPLFLMPEHPAQAELLSDGEAQVSMNLLRSTGLEQTDK
jgi:hypothetical protein